MSASQTEFYPDLHYPTNSVTLRTFPDKRQAVLFFTDSDNCFHAILGPSQCARMSVHLGQFAEVAGVIDPVPSCARFTWFMLGNLCAWASVLAFSYL